MMATLRVVFSAFVPIGIVTVSIPFLNDAAALDQVFLVDLTDIGSFLSLVKIDLMVPISESGPRMHFHVWREGIEGSLSYVKFRRNFRSGCPI